MKEARSKSIGKTLTHGSSLTTAFSHPSSFRRSLRLVNQVSHDITVQNDETERSTNVELSFHGLLDNISTHSTSMRLRMGSSGTSRLCQHAGCNTRSYFNYRSQHGARFCSYHKFPGMVDVLNKHCERAGCNKRSNYNDKDKHGTRFCTSHKLSGMIDVSSKICERIGCDKRSCYNNRSKRGGRFCATHKLPGMIAKRTKQCEHDKCMKQPNFNNRGECGGRFCDTHKLKNMINVKRKAL
jgi:hypothetical protein